MEVRLLRHATLLVTFAGRRLLVDPMLGPEWPRASEEPGSPVAGPRHPLPLGDAELGGLLTHLDGVLVTHTDQDHWDAAAVDRLPRNRPVFCRASDRATIAGAGFVDVRAVGSAASWDGLRVIPTGGPSGQGDDRAGIGFVLQAPGEPTLYIAGDTVLCPEVVETIRGHEPAATVVNAGAAGSMDGAPTTMSATQVEAVADLSATMSVLAVHMDTVSQCHLSRTALREHLAASPVARRIVIPEDGDRTVWLG